MNLKTKKVRGGKCELLAQVKKQVAVLPDYRTPINHPQLISFLTADQSRTGPCSHWLLAVTTVRLELNGVDPSFYSPVELGRDIFLLQVHLQDPPTISPRCYPNSANPKLAVSSISSIRFEAQGKLHSFHPNPQIFFQVL